MDLDCSEDRAKGSRSFSANPNPDPDPKSSSFHTSLGVRINHELQLTAVLHFFYMQSFDEKEGRREVEGKKLTWEHMILN